MGNGCYNLHRWSFNSIYNCLGPTLTLYEENHLKTNNHPMLFIPCQKKDEQNHPEDNQKLPGFFGNSSRPSWANSWVVGFFESKEINHPWMFVFFFFADSIHHEIHHHYSPENQHVPWKSMVGRCIPYWISPVLRDMLVFRGVNYPPFGWNILLDFFQPSNSHKIQCKEVVSTQTSPSWGWESWIHGWS